MSTRYVIEKFNLESEERKRILNLKGLGSGLMGLSQGLFKSYVTYV